MVRNIIIFSPLFLFFLSVFSHNSRIIIRFVTNSCAVTSTDTRGVIIVSSTSDPFDPLFISKSALNIFMAIGTTQGVFYLQAPSRTIIGSVTSSSSATSNQKNTVKKTTVQGVIILDTLGVPESFVTTTASGRGWQWGCRFDKTMIPSLSFFNSNIYIGDKMGPFSETEFLSSPPKFTGNIGYGVDQLHTLIEGSEKNAGSFNVAFGYGNNNYLLKGGSFNITIGVLNAMKGAPIATQDELKDDLLQKGEYGNRSNYNILLGTALFQNDRTLPLLPCKQNIGIGNMSIRNCSAFSGNTVIGNNNFFSASSSIAFKNITNNIVIGNGLFCFYNDTGTIIENINNNIIIYAGDILQSNDDAGQLNDLHGKSIISGTNHCIFVGTLGSKRRKEPLTNATFLAHAKETLIPLDGSDIPTPIWKDRYNLIGVYTEIASNETDIVPQIELNTALTHGLFILPILGVKEAKLIATAPTKLRMTGRVDFVVDASSVVAHAQDFSEILLEGLAYDRDQQLCCFEEHLFISLILYAYQVLNKKVLALVATEDAILSHCQSALASITNESTRESLHSELITLQEERAE